MGTKPVLRGCYEAGTLPDSETVPLDAVLDPFASHRGVRVCARRLGDLVQLHCERPRVQGRRRLGTSLHHQ